jgi:hypothetical protein
LQCPDPFRFPFCYAEYRCLFKGPTTGRIVISFVTLCFTGEMVGDGEFGLLGSTYMVARFTIRTYL